ncbi:MAG: fabG 2 [Firmicutes bacterium]|nr:fabG 2 [Bacillota bacterium]
MRLQDKVTIVTGAGQGIGKGIAMRFASEGAKVVVVDLNYDHCAAVQSEIEAMGMTAIAIKCDVSKRAKVEAMVEEVVRMFGTVDILINNAGITRDGWFMKMTDEQYDAVLNVNLKSMVLCAQSVLKHMIPQQNGKIVNMASIIGEMGNAGQTNYAVAKAGVIGLTKTLAKEFASKQINVNAVSPGFIDTEMTLKIPEKMREDILKTIPLGRSGTPLDIANACLFLASNEADYITGQVLRLNGGTLV